MWSAPTILVFQNMQAVSLLILVILAGFLFNKEKSPYARMIIGSIFGIMFFSIWPFTVFFVEIYQHTEVFMIISYIVISVIAAVLSILLLKIQAQLTTAIASLLIFVLTMFITYTFNAELKNRISILTGFFDYNHIVTTTNTPENINRRITHVADTYKLNIDNHWRKQTDKGPLFVYYHLFNNDKLIAEFRPKCFNKSDISLPEIIENVRKLNQAKNLKTKTSCYKNNAGYLSCQIDSFAEKNDLKRSRWFGLNANLINGVELDFVFYENKKTIANEINVILDSLVITNKAKNNSHCLGLTEWF